jgi:three-Cys-motif partner protein
MGMRYPSLRLIDGFAGPGRYEGGEPGSPVIMLRAFVEHAARPKIAAHMEYVFIEERLDRYEALLAEIAALTSATPIPSHVTIDIRHGSFGRVMPLFIHSDMPPTFVFVDPFGWSDAPMHLTSGIIGIDRCEALTYVPLPFIARFVSDPKVEESLTLLFGGESWKAARDASPAERVTVLHGCFQQELLRHCAYARSFEIHPDRSRGYTLFFGTRHVLGLEKMKEVMWKLDPAQGSRFTDSTDFGQTVLFEPTPDYRQLESMITAEFGLQEFTIDQAERFVLVNTPFAKSHLKVHTLRPAEAAGRLVVPNASDARRRGTYPPGTVLQFVPQAR